jgi:hypothetical protein
MYIRTHFVGMCELVQELGTFYKMQPEALANNVIFTIGKLGHKHVENGKILSKSSVQLVVQSLKIYGIEKVTQAGNGLFALGALIQNSDVALGQILTVEVADLLVTLLSVHGVDDTSVAVYGFNILEAMCSLAMSKGDKGAAVCGPIYRRLSQLCVCGVAVHLLSVYNYNPLNSNVEITVRAVNLLHLLCVKSAEAYKTFLLPQLRSTDAEVVLQQCVIHSVAVMEKHTNQQALELLNLLKTN